jgi:hypothetical protein
MLTAKEISDEILRLVKGLNPWPLAKPTRYIQYTKALSNITTRQLDDTPLDRFSSEILAPMVSDMHETTRTRQYCPTCRIPSPFSRAGEWEIWDVTPSLVPFVQPRGLDFAAQSIDDDFAVLVVRAYEIGTDIFWLRIDVKCRKPAN